jgi:hypothetical protein
MVVKRVLCQERLRRVPPQFSWVDQRLVRDKHICGLRSDSLALYLFLVTVSDAQGLSYYCDGAIERYLGVHPVIVAQSRAELVSAGLVAYSHPLYQVLSLENNSQRVAAAAIYEQPRSRSSSGELMTIGHILRNAMGGSK